MPNIIGLRLTANRDDGSIQECSFVRRSLTYTRVDFTMEKPRASVGLVRGLCLAGGYSRVALFHVDRRGHFLLFDVFAGSDARSGDFAFSDAAGWFAFAIPAVSDAAIHDDAGSFTHFDIVHPTHVGQLNERLEHVQRFFHG